MAYTIPEYVDTPEQAILAVASAVKGEQVTGGDGNVGTALDILADALAGENVTVPMTQQGAILALAQYVGGGGGVTLGNPCTAGVFSEDESDLIQCNYRASIDGAVKAAVTAMEMVAAAGFAMDIDFYSAAEPTVTATVIKPDQTTEAFTDFTVTPDQALEGYYHIAFTVPELPIDDTDPDNPPVYSMLMFTF